MTDDNRKRLTALIAASTKLDAAARLAKEATIDLARAGLIPRDPVQKIAAEIDAVIERIALVIERIP